MIHEVAGNCRQFGLKLRQLIDAHGLVSMELNNVDAPPAFVDPQSKRASALLGVKGPDVDDSFLMPGNLKVRIVTVRLLTFDECVVIRRHGAEGRKALAKQFDQDQTYHVSSIKRLSAAPPTTFVPAQEQEHKRLRVEGSLIPPRPTENKVWDTDSLRTKIRKLQGAGGTGALPILDHKTAGPELEVKALFAHALARPTPVSNAMSRFDARLRQMTKGAGAKTATEATAKGLANHVVSALTTHSQLAGWKHVQDYIIDPKAYLARSGTAPLMIDDPSRTIDILSVTGDGLVRRLLQRLEWLLDLQTKKNEEFDPDLFLAVLSVDVGWMDETSAFTRDAEAKVTDLLKRHAQRFAAFRDLQRRGVAWPHSSRNRKDIESANFVFRPMMVKRDRCVCDQCGVEVTGWRPWHNPWQLHDLSRHTADFHERVQRFGAAFAQTGFYTFRTGVKPPDTPATPISAAQETLSTTVSTTTATPPFSRSEPK